MKKLEIKLCSTLAGLQGAWLSLAKNGKIRKGKDFSPIVDKIKLLT